MDQSRSFRPASALSGSLSDQAGAGPTRRQFLCAGGLGALSFLWADWIRAEASGTGSGGRRAKSVILIFNCGAPSHIDLWDLKPHAPDNIRGEFKSVATNVAGIRGSELLPRRGQRGGG